MEGQTHRIDTTRWIDIFYKIGTFEDRQADRYKYINRLRVAFHKKKTKKWEL